MLNTNPVAVNDNIGVMSYSLSTDNSEKFEIISPILQDIFEFSINDIANNSKLIWDNIDSKFIVPIQIMIEESANELKPLITNFKYNAPSGKSKWLAINGIPNKKENGSITWLIIMQDLTKSRNANHNVQKLNFIYSTLLETLQDAVIVAKENFNIVSYNKSAEIFFGYKPHEVIAKDLHLLIPEQKRESHKIYLSEFINSNQKTKFIGNYRDVEYLDKQGNIHKGSAAVGKVVYDGEIMLIFTMRPVSKIIEDFSSRLLTSFISNFESMHEMIRFIKSDIDNINKDELLGKLDLLDNIANETIDEIIKTLNNR